MPIIQLYTYVRDLEKRQWVKEIIVIDMFILTIENIDGMISGTYDCSHNVCDLPYYSSANRSYRRRQL